MSAMDIDFTEYQLSTELLGHEDDVRGICICGDTGFATSSRDKTVRFWSIDPDDEKKRNYVSSKIMLGHAGFVSPLAWIPPNEKLPEGGLVSGGNDCLVILWDLKTAESVCTMKGHESQVTGVAVDDNFDIVSTSMDRTIRRWRNGQQVEFWEAHKAPIQTVLKLSSNEIVTGSSDMTLKLWRNNVCTHTFVGHAEHIKLVSRAKLVQSTVIPRVEKIEDMCLPKTRLEKNQGPESPTSSPLTYKRRKKQVQPVPVDMSSPATSQAPPTGGVTDLKHGRYQHTSPYCKY